MRVSVILCTYSPDMFEHFKECLESLINQTYSDIEIVCIVDGNKEYYEMIKENLSEFIKDEEMKLYFNEKNLGLSESRNRGIKEAKRDIIAFFDDDAVADKN